MFGIMEAILSFIRRQVGLRTDVADSSGSIHAKISHIINNRLQSGIGTSADTRLSNTVMGWLSSPIKSIQRGTATIDSGAFTGTQSISTVNTSKASLNITGYKWNGGTTNVSTAFCSVLVQSTLLPSSITFNRQLGDGSLYVYWEVIEYY